MCHFSSLERRLNFELTNTSIGQDYTNKQLKNNLQRKGNMTDRKLAEQLTTHNRASTQEYIQEAPLAKPRPSTTTTAYTKKATKDYYTT